jgi:hypothetical protein
LAGASSWIFRRILHRCDSTMTSTPHTAGAFRIRGAAMMPLRVGAVTATYPLGVLRADNNGISTDIGPRWLRKALLAMFAFGPNAPLKGWTGPLRSARWDEVDRALTAKRSVLISPKKGRACRFSVMRHRDILPLHEMLARHSIPTEPVRRTWSKALRHV